MGSTARVDTPDPREAFRRVLRAFEVNLLGRENRGQRTLAEGETRASRLLSGIQEQTLDLTERFAPQFQRLFSNLREEAIQRDPLARAQRDLALSATREQADLLPQLAGVARSGLRGIESGLPDDVRRTILEEARGNAVLRGTLQSPSTAVSEIARLAGGTERFRQGRLAQAQSILGGIGRAGSSGLAFTNVVEPQLFSPESILPTSSIPQFISQDLGNQLQANQQNASFQFERNLALGQGIGDFVGTFFPQLEGLTSGALGATPSESNQAGAGGGGGGAGAGGLAGLGDFFSSFAGFFS